MSQLELHEGPQMLIGDSDLQNYYESEKHAEMCNLIQQVVGDQALLATPEDYLQVVKSALGPGKYTKAISAIEKFTISCPESCSYSAEEIFVASSLVTSEKSSAPQVALLAWLNQFCEGALERGQNLKAKVLALLEEFSEENEE